MSLSLMVNRPRVKVSLKEVHCQLGHPSLRYTKNTLRKIYGDTKVNDWNWECVNCGQAKIARKFLNKLSTTKSTVPGQRIFVDISSVSTKSFGGSKFWVLVVDEYTSKKWAGFISSKDLIGKCLSTIIESENKLVSNIRYIRCDNGGENLELKGFLRADLRARIKLEYTAPYTPHQNGLVERGFGYLYGMLRATLNGLKLKNETEKTSFWAECARHLTMMDGTIVRDDKKVLTSIFMTE